MRIPSRGPLLFGASFGVVAIAACHLAFPDAGPAASPASDAAPDAVGTAAPPQVDGATPLDAAGDARDAACPLDTNAGAFCDDFETCDVGHWSGANSDPPTVIRISDAGAWRGACALHAMTRDGGGSGAKVSWRFEDGPSSLSRIMQGTIAVRMYLRAPQRISNGTGLLLLQAPVDGGSDSENVRLDIVYDKWETVAFGASLGGVKSRRATVGPKTDNTWMCVEWVVTLAPQGHTLVFVDGKPVLNAAMDDLVGSTAGYDRIYLGFISNQDVAPPQDGYFDDVAIALYPGDTDIQIKQRIGCE